MERVIVHHSSTIASYGYEEHPSVGQLGNSGVLEVEFKGRKGGQGSVYQCFDVPPSKWAGLLQAPSPGGYYAEHIKGQYRTVRIS
jgi:hypothetical protein